MVKTEQLKRLAETYLKFLIARDESGLKPYLSQDFMTRLRVTEQLRLIKTLPTALNYGLVPEAHIWDQYLIEQTDGEICICPFQFDVSYRNLMNPLLSETMTVTIHALMLEGSQWKIRSVLSEPDHNLLVRYASRYKNSTQDTSPSDRKIQPKK